MDADAVRAAGLPRLRHGRLVNAAVPAAVTKGRLGKLAQSIRRFLRVPEAHGLEVRVLVEVGDGEQNGRRQHLDFVDDHAHALVLDADEFRDAPEIAALKAGHADHAIAEVAALSRVIAGVGDNAQPPLNHVAGEAGIILLGNAVIFLDLAKDAVLQPLLGG